MRRMLACGLLVLMGLGGIGCVAQSEADKLRTAYRQSEAQVQDLKARLDEKNAMIAAMQASGDRTTEMAARLEEIMADRDRYRSALEKAEEALRGMKGDALPVELSDALAEMAAANPELMSYDPELGMIQLKSDLTFALGSATLSPAATSSLKTLAGVLNSRLAEGYEVRIVGHTDNVPVRNPANVRTFGDNWGLSAFRARAVLKALAGDGVSPSRMYIAGYGQHRPVVANGPKGAAANRRVEIYLKPMTGAAAADTAPAPAPAETTTTTETTDAPAPVTGPPAGFK